MSQLTNRTRRIAFSLRLSCYAAMALLIGFAAYAVLTPGFLEQQAAVQLLLDPVTWAIRTPARLLLFGVGAVALATVLYTLWHTARLFGLYSAGEAISPNTARSIRRIGLGLLAQAAIGFAGPTLAGLILSIDAPDGKGMLVIQIGSTDIGFALVGGLMLLIGLVMVQAVEAVRENREFI